MSLKTRVGLEYLEDAIRDVLNEAEKPLNAGEVSRRAGIPFEYESEEEGGPYYRITRGLLLFLESKGDVERPEGKWQITPQGTAQ